MAEKPAPPPELTSSTEAARAMGRRIQQARKAADFHTAKDFADALQISVWTVHSWESGKSQPRYDMLATVSQLTDQPMAHLLGEEASEDEELEAGVYGVAPYNQAASEALTELIERAQNWDTLLRFNTPIVATAEKLEGLRAALEQMRAE